MGLEILLLGHDGAEFSFEYDIDFQSPENFRNEVVAGFQRPSTFVPVLYTERGPLGFERLDKMIIAAAINPQVFSGWKFNGRKLVLQVKFEAPFTSASLSHNASSSQKPKLEDKGELRMYEKAQLLMPRVWCPEIAQITGVEQGHFILEKASRKLKKEYQQKYQQLQNEVDGLRTRKHRDLNKYLSNCNYYCRQEGPNWKTGKTQYLYESFLVWKKKQLQDFLNNSNDDEGDYEDEVELTNQMENDEEENEFTNQKENYDLESNEDLGADLFTQKRNKYIMEQEDHPSQKRNKYILEQEDHPSQKRNKYILEQEDHPSQKGSKVATPRILKKRRTNPEPNSSKKSNSSKKPPK